MNKTVHWSPVTLAELASLSGGELERGVPSRRIHAFVASSTASRTVVGGDSSPAIDRFTLVAAPQGPNAAAILAVAASAGAVALVEREQPVPASMAVLRVPVLADAVARLALARRAASRARVLAVVGADAATVAVPLAAACRRRWRTVGAETPADLDAALLSFSASTERAVVVLDGGNLISLVADMTLAAPAIVVAAPPRPGDPGPMEFAAALPSTTALILDDADPRAGLIRRSSTCRVMTSSEILGSSSAAVVAAPRGIAVVPSRGHFTCRGLEVRTSFPPAALTVSRLAAAAALFTGTDALDIVEAFAHLLPASMPLPVSNASACADDLDVVEALPDLARAV